MSTHVLLVRGTSLIARLIQYLTGSPYSHSAFVFDRKVTVEADIGGVTSRNLAAYPWAYDLFRIPAFDTDVVAERQLQAWAYSQLGTRYDYGKVIASGIARWFQRKFAESKLLLGHVSGLQPLLDHRGAFHCAEFVWAGLTRVGIPMQTSGTNIVPGDLAFEPALVLVDPTDLVVTRGGPRHESWHRGSGSR